MQSSPCLQQVCYGVSSLGALRLKGHSQVLAVPLVFVGLRLKDLLQNSKALGIVFLKTFASSDGERTRKDNRLARSVDAALIQAPQTIFERIPITDSDRCPTGMRSELKDFIEPVHHR